MHKNCIVILMADDDLDDQIFVKHILKDFKLVKDLRIVNDGTELLEYLACKGRYENKENAPKPNIIIINLTLPKLSGIEIIDKIRSDLQYQATPLIIFTDEYRLSEIFKAYQAGANTFIRKPVTMQKLKEQFEVLIHYWSEIAELPPKKDMARCVKKMEIPKH